MVDNEFNGLDRRGKSTKRIRFYTERRIGTESGLFTLGAAQPHRYLQGCVYCDLAALNWAFELIKRAGQGEAEDLQPEGGLPYKLHGMPSFVTDRDTCSFL